MHPIEDPLACPDLMLLRAIALGKVFCVIGAIAGMLFINDANAPPGGDWVLMSDGNYVNEEDINNLNKSNTDSAPSADAIHSAGGLMVYTFPQPGVDSTGTYSIVAPTSPSSSTTADSTQSGDEDSGQSNSSAGITELNDPDNETPYVEGPVPDALRQKEVPPVGMDYPSKALFGCMIGAFIAIFCSFCVSMTRMF